LFDAYIWDAKDTVLFIYFCHGKIPCYVDVWGSGEIAPAFLTLEVYGGEWSGSYSSRFTWQAEQVWTSSRKEKFLN
jgi:hypothetical protein